MTICIVQARMNSQRLPGKVLKKVLGRPLLGYQVERLKRASSFRALVIATSVGAMDDPIARFCHKEGILCFRGHEDDVLARYYGAAKANSATLVVRICADSPLVDPEIVDKTVNHYLRNVGRYDYVSNVLKRTYPRGLDCEVFSFKALQEAHLEAIQQNEREHVTLFIYSRPERYRLGNVENETNESAHRWTVDTEEDFELVRKILSHLYPVKPAFSLREALQLCAQHPEWRKINERVEQKRI